jgi:hypothetical protein
MNGKFVDFNVMLIDMLKSDKEITIEYLRAALVEEDSRILGAAIRDTIQAWGYEAYPIFEESFANESVNFEEVFASLQQFFPNLDLSLLAPQGEEKMIKGHA